MISCQTNYQNKQQCIEKSHSTQHSLSFMLNMWKKILDEGGHLCAIFMNLPKAFVTLKQDLLSANLGVYGLETDALAYR